MSSILSATSDGKPGCLQALTKSGLKQMILQAFSSLVFLTFLSKQLGVIMNGQVEFQVFIGTVTIFIAIESPPYNGNLSPNVRNGWRVPEPPFINFIIAWNRKMQLFYL